VELRARKNRETLTRTDEVRRRCVVEGAIDEPCETCGGIAEDALLETHCAEDAVPPLGILEATPNKPAILEICENKVGVIERAVLKCATCELRFGEFSMLEDRLRRLNSRERTPVED
jgi:hypothetical protein